MLTHVCHPPLGQRGFGLLAFFVHRQGDIVETLTLINGNGNEFTRPLPKICITCQHQINDVALERIVKQTGLVFSWKHWGYESQPTSSQQLLLLLMAYNFKTRYFDNFDSRNTLYLKFCDHGFFVDHVCIECCKANHVQMNYNSIETDSRISL
jgi:hypothetical protein